MMNLSVLYSNISYSVMAWTFSFRYNLVFISHFYIIRYEPPRVLYIRADPVHRRCRLPRPTGALCHVRRGSGCHCSEVGLWSWWLWSDALIECFIFWLQLMMFLFSVPGFTYPQWHQGNPQKRCPRRNRFRMGQMWGNVSYIICV